MLYISIIFVILLLSAKAVSAKCLIFNASDYAVLDSDVIKGGGTDATAALQSILDKAKDGKTSVKLIMDGAALVTGLKIYSNTTIECLTPSCGFFMKEGSNRALIMNGNPDFHCAPEERDRNITMVGGTYNYNGRGQLHDVPFPPEEEEFYRKNLDASYWNVKICVIFELYGVENVNMKDMTIMNQRSYVMQTGNFKFFNMDNINVILNDYMSAQNQDGFHFFGPGQFLTMNNITGTSGDDFIALAPDERDRFSEITDVTINGLHLNNADQGVRILVRDKGSIDRVLIKNVTGTFRSFGFYINPWYATETGGCCKNIVIDGVDIHSTAPAYGGPQHLFSLGGCIENIILKNIHYHGTNPHHIVDIRTSYAGPCPTVIDNMALENLYIHEDANDHVYFKFYGEGAVIKNLKVRNVHITGSKKQGTLFEADKGNVIEKLYVSDFYSNALRTVCSEADKQTAKKIYKDNIVIE